MNTLYLDIFSGISGDMFLGAMIDLGVDFNRLERELAKLHLDGYHLHIARRQKMGIEGVKFDVHLEHDHEHDHAHEHHHEHEEQDHGRGPSHHHHEHDEDEHEHGHDRSHHHHDDHAHARHDHDHQHAHQHEGSRNFTDIKKLIADSALSEWVKEKSVAVFQRVAAAEGKIHGMPPEQVHFHEVGAIDSIVDIVGACIALELLGKPRVLAAPVVEGTGWVNCAHGRFPVPTTATLEILGARGIALTQCEEPHELVTPTGAAILAEFAEQFAPMRSLVARKIGYGLGTRDNKTRPNVLRAAFGESASPSAAASHDWETDTVAVLETNLDDIQAEILGHFVEKALAAGALDVFHIPIQMKKTRPAVLLTLLCPEADADRFAEMILRETSAFGVRRHTAERRKLKREFVTVRVHQGEVTVKIGRLDGRVLHAAPEYESCKSLAAQTGVPLKEIYQAAANALKI